MFFCCTGVFFGGNIGVFLWHDVILYFDFLFRAFVFFFVFIVLYLSCFVVVCFLCVWLVFCYGGFFFVCAFFFSFF